VLQIARLKQSQAFLLFSEANIDAGSVAVNRPSPSLKMLFATHPFLRAADGKITFLREYFDPVRAARALGTPILDLES
jgi:hypothetical protein